MTRNAPKQPLVHVSLRVPKDVADWYAAFPKPSEEMRKALFAYAHAVDEDTDEGMTKEDYEAIYGWGGQG